MTGVVARKAIAEGAPDRVPRPLLEWRACDAYVLLAEPGAGKTEAFRMEERQSEGGLYVTARDFLSLRAERFRNRAPIYIDGLDEIRAGSTSFSRPLDDIRRRLDEIGRPRFRLSCREADWRSAVDQDALRAVAPRDELAVLHLAELEEQDIAGLLRSKGVKNPAEFLDNATKQGIRPLLGNPLLLDLMVRAVGCYPESWPASRSAIYREACRQLATELNEQHRAESQGRSPSIDNLIDDAGLLSALYLLAGLADLRIDRLPATLNVRDARMALASKLFVGEGESRTPRHRTIAEYLAARALSSRIEGGLPVGRVLALMSGTDGGIVDPLRGLHAWLSTHCKPERAILIDRDPLGIVLYGDLTDFSQQEKQRVLRALHAEANRYPWFRKGQWHAQPFGALGTPDMTEHFRQELASPDRSESHQSLLQCVLEAIEYGKPMPGIAGNLRVLVRDRSFMSSIRADALDAWLRQSKSDAEFVMLLEDIERGDVADADDELAGRLLGRLYPKTISPADVFKYLHPLKRDSFYGQYQDFWRRRLLPATPRESLGELMNGWALHSRPVPGRHESFLSDEISGQLLEAALSAHGEQVSVETLHRWLGVALDEHDFVRLSQKNLEGARRWLSERPGTLKSLVAYGWSLLQPGTASRRRHYWRAESRMLGATRPSDWYAWLLEQASRTDDEELAEYCLSSAAHLAIDRRPGFEMTMEAVANWVEQNRAKWPAADDWLRTAWTMPLDHPEAEHARETKGRLEKERSERTKRRGDLARHLLALKDGSAHPALLRQVALAYQGRFYDVYGDTELERVQDFLGGVSKEEAEAVIAGQEAALYRADLPSVDDVLATGLKARAHYIGAACKLGATLAYRRDPEVVTRWSDELAGKLAAFWLTEGVGEEPDWFQLLAARRAAVVAPVLVRFAAGVLKKRGNAHIPGLWLLAKENRFAECARLAVPELVRAFPLRADESKLRVLNGELLPAARLHLPAGDYAALVAARLARKGLGPAQRISYLVAGLSIDGPKYSGELLRAVGSSEAKAAHLGRALEWQGDRRKGLPPLPASVLARLVEMIAPFASPERPTGAHWVSDSDRRRDWVHSFVSQLASDPSLEASEELKRLAAHPRLGAWTSSLQGAIFDQSKARRETGFCQASADDVAKVLANLAPASSRDLAALVLDRLDGLQDRLRGDDTNGLRLFYRDDGMSPRAENDCRDVLLERLRPSLLSLGVDIEKEAQSASDTRADLRIKIVHLARTMSLPIEIKREDNHELWSAWRKQLLHYVRDPNSDGVGIYLVLWFGRKPRSTPEGKRPQTPVELSTLLCQTLPNDLRQGLLVRVLDLSPITRP
jgi:hypothetical protein